MLNKIDGLPRKTKRMILFLTDIVLVAFSLSMAFALRFGMTMPVDPIRAHWALFPTMLAIGALTIWAMRLNHIKIQTVENNTVLRLAVSAGVLTVSAMAVSFLLNLSAPRSVPLIFGALFFVSSVLVHFLGRAALERASASKKQRFPVAIYGAGNTGEQLAAALNQNGDNKPVCFIDDNRQLHRMVVRGLKVHSPKSLRRLIKKHGLKRIVIAMPSASSYRRQEILDALSSQPIEVMELPNVSDQVSDRAIQNGLQAKRFKDISSKTRLNARNPEILATCRDKTVLIAGAGGAVGAEISRQIIRFEPAKVILLERNEAALLAIMQSVNSLVSRTGSKTEVKAKTGSIGARGRVDHLLRSENVQIIINAAHFGDPRLSEDNLLDVVSTNTLGPLNLAESAIENDVEQLVLLSSERVTAPRHLVDQTQKLAESLVLGLAAKATSTKISFLRFGQTAGPVGDIMPLLETQIRNHNSVTLPDPEMTRFFVTTSKAADLILSALPYSDQLHARPAHLSKGEPRKVMDFVNKVVDMSGKGLRTESNPYGVEIKFCGLRPGEELHESNGASASCTPLDDNPNILMAMPAVEPTVEHGLLMKRFKSGLDQHDENALRRLLGGSYSKAEEKVLQTA